jgi:hypothetical protein
MRHIGDVTQGMGNPQPRGVDDPYAGGIMTKHGWFSAEDIGQAEGRIARDAKGNRVLQFPYAHNGRHEPMYRDIPTHKLEEGG